MVRLVKFFIQCPSHMDVVVEIFGQRPVPYYSAAIALRPPFWWELPCRGHSCQTCSPSVHFQGLESAPTPGIAQSESANVHWSTCELSLIVLEGQLTILTAWVPTYSCWEEYVIFEWLADWIPLLYLAVSLSLSFALSLSTWLLAPFVQPNTRQKKNFWHWSFGLVPLTRHHVTPLWSAYCTTYVCLYRHNHTHTYKNFYYIMELWWIMMVIFIILNYRHTQKHNLYIDISQPNCMQVWNPGASWGMLRHPVFFNQAQGQGGCQQNRVPRIAAWQKKRLQKKEYTSSPFP